MYDLSQLNPGDVLIGFSKHGPVTVVSNKPSFDGMRELRFQVGEHARFTVNLNELGENVRVLKSKW